MVGVREGVAVFGAAQCHQTVNGFADIDAPGSKNVVVQRCRHGQVASAKVASAKVEMDECVGPFFFTNLNSFSSQTP